MTKAASNTAGSGFVEPSPLASSVGFFLGRRAGDCVLVPLDDRERRLAAEADELDVCVGRMALFCFDCSSAIWRSIAPLILCMVKIVSNEQERNTAVQRGPLAWK